MISPDLLPSITTSPRAQFSSDPNLLGEFMVDQLGYQPGDLPRVSVDFAGVRSRPLVPRKSSGYSEMIGSNGHKLWLHRLTRYSSDFHINIVVYEDSDIANTEETLIHELTHGVQSINRPEMIEKGTRSIAKHVFSGSMIGAAASKAYINLLVDKFNEEAPDGLLIVGGAALTTQSVALGSIVGFMIAHKKAVHENEARDYAQRITSAKLLHETA